MKLFKSKKGITPVIAIVLLLMMTVAAAGAAFVWITEISEKFREKTSQRLGKELKIKSISCEDNNIDVFISNTGDKVIDVVPVNVIVYDYSTGKANSSLSLSKSETFRDAGGIAAFTSPGEWDQREITLDNEFQEGKTYTVEFEFPQDSMEPLSEECKAD